MTAILERRENSSLWARFCEWITSVENRIYIGWFGVIMFPTLLTATSVFIIAFVAAPPVDIDGIREPVSGSLLYGNNIITGAIIPTSNAIGLHQLIRCLKIAIFSDNKVKCGNAKINNLNALSLYSISLDLPISKLSLSLSSFPEFQDKLTLLETFIRENNEEKNPYELAIEVYKKLKHPEGTVLEQHHILPKFDGGDNSLANLMKVTILDHIFLHWLRWKVYKKSGDQKAYLFRQYNTEERAVARKTLAKEANIASGKGWFCSTTQRELGLKGGAKGGLANTEAQYLARQKIGLTYGCSVGKGNQSPRIKTFLKEPSCWDHVSGILIIVSPQETFQDIITILRQTVNQEIKNPSTMYKLLNKKSTSKARFYGWKIVNMPIRSETEMVNDSEKKIFFIKEESIPE